MGCIGPMMVAKDLVALGCYTCTWSSDSSRVGGKPGERLEGGSWESSASLSSRAQLQRPTG